MASLIRYTFALFFCISLSKEDAVSSAEVSCQSDDEPAARSTSSQCLIQSHRFRRSTRFVEEDNHRYREEHKRQNEISEFSSFVDKDDHRYSEEHKRHNETSEFSNFVEIDESGECEGKSKMQGVEPRCKTSNDCEPRPNKNIACLSGFCTDPSNVKFDWAPATIDSYCPCHDLGKRTQGQPKITDCKKKCEEMPDCTGFTRGKGGQVDSFCWFFSTCTRNMAKSQLKKDIKFDVFLLSASSVIDVPVMKIKRMELMFRGRRKSPSKQEGKCLSSGQCNDLPGIVLDPPLQCTDGVCHDTATEKFKWTFGTVNHMCKVSHQGYLGKLANGKHYDILQCKKKCEAIPRCTGFNRGKKGRIEGQCWFFSKCGKHTPRYFKPNTHYNMYFVTGVSTIPVPVKTYETQPVLLRG